MRTFADVNIIFLRWIIYYYYDFIYHWMFLYVSVISLCVFSLCPYMSMLCPYMLPYNTTITSLVLHYQLKCMFVVLLITLDICANFLPEVGLIVGQWHIVVLAD